MQHFPLSVAILALLAISLSPVRAQSVRSVFTESPVSGLYGHVTNQTTTIDVPMPTLKIKQTGLLTSRLSEKDRARWKAIEQIVFATNTMGEPLHPVLQELWQWADNSGHQIQLELVESKNLQSSMAGSFNIEQLDPAGRCHTTTLKLYPSNIDQALISPHVARPSGFIPFESLRKEERYVEVLGHELAHVKYVLNNTVRTQLVHELIETTNDILLLHAQMKPATHVSPEMKQRLNQRDQLLRELETQAEAIEEVIWRELISSQKIRAEKIALHRRR